MYRKINTGVRIEYDEEKGIINEETKEVIIPLEKIIKIDDDDEDEENSEDENDIDEDNNNEEDKKEEKNNIKNNKEIKENMNGQECEDIDTTSKPEEKE